MTFPADSSGFPLFNMQSDYISSQNSSNGSFVTESPNIFSTNTYSDEEIFKKLRNNSISHPYVEILTTLYFLFILFGSIGNSLVILIVIRKPLMRTARNIFILNLAISDLLLCCVTMPLTLLEIVSKSWPFGSCESICKLIAMLQATSIFVSTLSITAIALDRYQVIVYPTRESLQLIGAIGILVCIWLLSIGMASPLFIYKTVHIYKLPEILHQYGYKVITFCVENWPVKEGRFYFSVFALCLQYLVPIIIVSAAYIRIYYKLKNRIPVLNVQTAQRSDHRERRMKRTNILLISIAAIFGICWLPLNLFLLYTDAMEIRKSENLLIVYAICHLIAMSSACANPLLYGYLNENFRKEFKELLCCSRNTNNVNLNATNLGSNRSNHRRRFWRLFKKSRRSTTGNNEISQADTRLMEDGTGGRQTLMVTESMAITDNKFSTEITTLVGTSVRSNTTTVIKEAEGATTSC